MVSICFVTNELHPLQPGGVGRLMYNFAVQNLEAGFRADMHFLLPAEAAAQAESIRATYGTLARIHFCSKDASVLGEFGQHLLHLLQPGSGDVPAASNLNEHIGRSLKYYAGLLDAQAATGVDFDIIEFPDFGGWAVAAQAAKRARLAFENTVIAVRLHSTFGLISVAERYYHRPSLWLSTMWDMERKALDGADLAIGHLDAIADYNAAAYGLSDDWRSGVVTEFPPITLDEPEDSAGDAAASGGARDFVFSSRLQPFKRPDTFVRAAVRMLRESPSCRSLFRIASYGWDEDYIAWLRSLVPADLRLRIRFMPVLTQEERTRLLRRSIVVIPSDYESLCLFAYESAMAGLTVILNRQCAAFGRGPRWIDGRNCLMFDGSYIDLARVMNEALTWTATDRVDATPDQPYWQARQPSRRQEEMRVEPIKELDVIAFGFTKVAELNERLLLLDGAPRGSDWHARYHAIVPRALLREAGVHEGQLDRADLDLHLIDSDEVTADDIAVVLGRCAGEVVAFRPLDMRVDPAFIETALAALAADPGLGAVTSHTLMAEKDLGGPVARARLYAGDLLTAAVATSRVCHRASVFRRKALERVSPRMDARDRWFEDLCARLVDEGCRVLCAPAAPVTEPTDRPFSRITDEVYFATRATDVGVRLGLPYPLGSLSHSLGGDFRNGEAPASKLQDPLSAAARSWPHANFARSEITGAKGGDRDRYRDIKLLITDLRIKANSWDRVRLKLGISENLPEIVLREQDQIIFDTWPPGRSDQRGPLVEYCASAHPTKGRAVAEAMLTMPIGDRRRLGSLLRALPAMVAAARLDKAVDRAVWLSAAESLVESWKLDGWE